MNNSPHFREIVSQRWSVPPEIPPEKQTSCWGWGHEVTLDRTSTNNSESIYLGMLVGGHGWSTVHFQSVGIYIHSFDRCLLSIEFMLFFRHRFYFCYPIPHLSQHHNLLESMCSCARKKKKKKPEGGEPGGRTHSTTGSTLVLFTLALGLQVSSCVSCFVFFLI